MGHLSRPGPPAPMPIPVPYGDCDCRVAGRGGVAGEELPEDGRRVAPHPQLDPRRTPSQGDSTQPAGCLGGGGNSRCLKQVSLSLPIRQSALLDGLADPIVAVRK